MAVRPNPPVCLVAENEALIGMMIEEQLQDYGLRVLGPFATCESAMAAISDATPDVALIDYLLRDGACLKLADELARRGVPFAFLSGYDQPLRENQTRWPGVKWLQKPLPMDALRQTLKELLPEF